MIKLFNILTELIGADEAITELGAIQTIIDGKRDVGAIAFASVNKSTANYIKELIDENGLKTFKVPSNPSELYIIFRPKAENQAKELLSIAEKYKGYFSAEATEDDSRRIGQLLGYKPSDIEDYIKHNRQRRNK